MKNILIVEDDKALAEGIVLVLQQDGFVFRCCHSAKEARKMLETESFDLVLLDINLPDGSGLDICRRLRKEGRNDPVIFLTALDTELHEVTGFQAGADDYITKPFGSSELLARIRTALRHGNRPVGGSAMVDRPYKAKGLVIDFDRRLVTVEGEAVHLTQVEFKIVSFLARNAGRVMTYDTLISHVWGPYADDNNRILRVNMANIRRKLEKNPAEPQFILTEIGVGYRMAEDENQENDTE